MAKRDVLSISLKILGVVSLAYAILGIPNLLLTLGMPISDPTLGVKQSIFVWIEAAVIVLYATLSCWLIASSDSISRRMIKDDSLFALPETLHDRKTAFILALRVLGVIFSVQGIGLLARAIGAMIFDHTSHGFAVMQWSQILECVAYLGVGAYLLLCSGQFAAFIYKHEPNNGGGTDD